MVRIFSLLIGVVLVTLGWQACTKATLVGNDLLDEEIRTVGYTDTFRIRATVVPEDSVLTHSGTTGAQIVEHSFGKLNDPILGRTESVIVSQMFLNGIGSQFLAYDIDSVVMTLAYDTTGRYGSRDEVISVSATRNFTELNVTEDYWSNQRFSKNFVPMGERKSFIPNYTDSVTIQRPNDTTTLEPHLRIPMGQDFINSLMAQPPATFELADSFAAWFQGVHLEVSEGENTMIGVDLNNPVSGMTVYYSQADSAFYRSYQFVFTAIFNAHVQVATFSNDYSNSQVEQFIGNQEQSDSLIFLQAMSGLNTELTFDRLDDFRDVLVNQAILDFYVADLPDDDLGTYPLSDRIQTRILNDDDMLINSRDVRLAFGINNIDFFGGAIIEDEEGRLVYRMNVTASVQDIISRREGNKLFLSSYLKQNNPRRVILYGPGHSQFPAKLRLTYTQTL